MTMKEEDTITIPRSLLSATSTTMWVYAHLLDKADANRRVSIMPKWNKAIGLPALQLHKALETLVSERLITTTVSKKIIHVTLADRA